MMQERQKHASGMNWIVSIQVQLPGAKASVKKRQKLKYFSWNASDIRTPGLHMIIPPGWGRWILLICLFCHWLKCCSHLKGWNDPSPHLQGPCPSQQEEGKRKGSTTPTAVQSIAKKFLTHFMCLCAWSLSRVWLCDPMHCSPPGSSVLGDSPGKNTEWVALLQGFFPSLTLLRPSCPEVSHMVTPSFKGCWEM